MSATNRVRKVQFSIKLPPDIERKIRKEVDDGEYTNMTDAITGILRLYFQNNKIELLQETIDNLKSEIETLKERNANIEKIICELQVQGK